MPGLRMVRLVALPLACLATACEDKSAPTAPGNATQDEEAALEDAAEMLGTRDPPAGEGSQTVEPSSAATGYE